ncbi:3'-5' exonuclease [Cerasicoccus arenae]|uniref:DNA polymerase III subunit epsilon n=1 Tax=Cerasicoccus arenae TaxID=424488 RepID=A0A8J3GD29_9BACT|nr:3'-5' exonuclease [Cerasicoccus arenae]MBK1858672.1 3'-5' exonuclease [Cerasicoccus arenae]GHB98234.1 DNA polymerase III subunit epsilon [Cerasicoccus arenae]
MSLFGDEDEIQGYREAFTTTWTDDSLVSRVRFVSLDCETTGLNPQKDSIITIGAVAVEDGQIIIEDQYEALLKIAYNTSSVVIHGITAEEAAENGLDEAEALIGLLKYLGDGVIVGHHIGFDVEVIRQACLRRFGLDFHNRWLDTMDLTLHLERDGMFDAGETNVPFKRTMDASADFARSRDFSLDGLCRRFGVDPHDRHTAAGDAFITAQIFIKLLRIAKRAGRTTLAQISQPYVDEPDSPKIQP